VQTKGAKVFVELSLYLRFVLTINDFPHLKTHYKLISSATQKSYPFSFPSCIHGFSTSSWRQEVRHSRPPSLWVMFRPVPKRYEKSRQCRQTAASNIFPLCFRARLYGIN